MKPRHRFLLAHPSDETRAREHASALAEQTTREEGDPITVEVALKDDCPPGQMFLMYYLPRPTWLVDTVLGVEGDAADSPLTRRSP